MNKINQLFDRKPNGICSVFVTAGFPHLNATVDIVLDLERSGVDMVEIGIPFSDPLADGETIQNSSKIALENGMNLHLLLDQIREIRRTSSIPIVLMGYLNPILSFGLEDFLKKAEEVGVDGLIIPDISLEEYELNFQQLFNQFNVPLTFLVTPKTSLNRLMRIHDYTKTFIYYVSSASTTGRSGSFSAEQVSKFDQFKKLKLSKPVLMGFGIHNAETFNIACHYFNGGIIGSAFIRHIQQGLRVSEFVDQIKEFQK